MFCYIIEYLFNEELRKELDELKELLEKQPYEEKKENKDGKEI